MPLALRCWVVDESDLETSVLARLPVVLEVPKLPDGYVPGCSNWRCLCWRPGEVCDEFMGLDGWRSCPRCGWAHELHVGHGGVATVEECAGCAAARVVFLLCWLLRSLWLCGVRGFPALGATPVS